MTVIINVNKINVCNSEKEVPSQVLKKEGEVTQQTHVVMTVEKRESEGHEELKMKTDKPRGVVVSCG